MCSNYLPKVGVISLSFKMLYIKAGHFIQRYLLYFKWDIQRSTFIKQAFKLNHTMDLCD